MHSKQDLPFILYILVNPKYTRENKIKKTAVICNLINSLK